MKRRISTEAFTRARMRAAGFIVLGLLVGFGAGYAFESWNANGVLNSIRNSFTPVTLGDSTYALVHPLLSYRTPEATVLGQYQSLENSMQSDIDSAKSTGNVSQVSVYFRDLDQGRWVGINETQTYYPASLLKVPVMIAYYKEAEDDPSILDEPVVYQNVAMPDPFDATSTLAVGQTYTVEQLIESMITDSDNGATFTLLDRINPEVLSSVYDALGITNPGDDSDTYQISARTYGLFFRVLYNATYLDPEYSEKALDLLSKATFTDGLVAGVPSDTLVAHKFGEHVLATGTTATGVELSDCGIVYYPAHPYLLCVMTSAKDVPTATSVIASVSKTAYDAIVATYPATTTPAK